MFSKSCGSVCLYMPWNSWQVKMKFHLSFVRSGCTAVGVRLLLGGRSCGCLVQWRISFWKCILPLFILYLGPNSISKCSGFLFILSNVFLFLFYFSLVQSKVVRLVALRVFVTRVPPSVPLSLFVFISLSCSLSPSTSRSLFLLLSFSPSFISLFISHFLFVSSTPQLFVLSHSLFLSVSVLPPSHPRLFSLMLPSC